MPYQQPLSDADAPQPAREMFQTLQARLGTVPNIFRTLAHEPAVLEATLSMNRAISKDLDPKLRELAYLKCSQLNNCHY